MHTSDAAGLADHCCTGADAINFRNVSNLTIGPNNAFINADIGVYFVFDGGETNLVITGNNFSSCNQSIELGPSGSGSQVLTGIQVDHNAHVQGVNWDNTNNDFHHNFFHPFTNAGTTAIRGTLYVDDNTMSGDMGNHSTSFIYLENIGSGAMDSWYIFNNTFDKTSATNASSSGMIAPTSSNGFLLNNTIRDAGGTGSQAWTMFHQYASGWTLNNNVFQQNGAGTGSGLFVWADGGAFNTSSDKNVYYDANPDQSWRKAATYYATLAAWRTACSCDTGAVITDPKLNSDMTLGANSSAMGLGTNLTSLGIAALNVDKNGVARPSTGTWDAGAYNAGSGGTPNVSISPTSFAFGNVVVGNPSATQTVTLTNTGTATLNISSITFTGTNTGDFSKTTTCGATVAAAGTCTVTVTFTPTATGARSASISFADDAASSPQAVTMTGTGTTISLVHFSACPSQSWTGSCTITSTTAGNSLVVGYTSNNSQGAALITGVTDNAGDTCTQVIGARSTNVTPNSSADIWTCFAGHGGATSITVTTNAVATAELGVWEVANIQSVDAKCAGNSQASSATPSGCPLITTVASEFLVEIADYQGSITGMNTGNAFLSDSTQQGNGYAHLVVSSKGTYAAQWASSLAGTFNSSGVSLK